MLTKIDPEKLTLNPFDAIGRRWMLITAGTRGNCNTMTASWGGLGILWNMPVATVYIRPQRHTKTFVDREAYFTLSFLPEERREDLLYCGSVSGRDEDKIAHCGLTVATASCGAPYFAEADLVLVCRKLYRQSLTPESFLDHDPDVRCYPEHDYHDMYIAQITEACQNL